jgi:gluconolactonase
VPDGIQVDQSGNLWATGPGGVLVLSPDGKLLCTIVTDQDTSNCTFGPDDKVLYMTADSQLLRLRLKE